MEEELIEEQPKQPTKVNTHGRWMKYSEFETLETGKSYRVTVAGDCMMALSKTTPTIGIKTNSFEFTASDEYSLWVLTK
jgi:hypothetical protein